MSISASPLLLTLNAGSSSIKISLYVLKEETVVHFLSGQIAKVGTSNTVLRLSGPDGTEEEIPLAADNFQTAGTSLIRWLNVQTWFKQVIAVGHRIVHGMHHAKAAKIDESLINELQRLIDFDPDHLPAEIQLIRLLKENCPQLFQVACFDTAFHQSLPAVAKTYAIPQEYAQEGIQRYGFHGLSYRFLMQELHRDNPEEASKKIILAHLGNGASLAAVREGTCVDTSMGFTPTAGLVMSTRSGDLDPGIAWYLLKKGMNAKSFNHLINHQSGLLALSGFSSDMQELLEKEQDVPGAKLAVEVFCYQIRKYIGAYMAALGGLDLLVFSGGIGEHADIIRSRICRDFAFAGILLDADRNCRHERLISTDDSRVRILVIPTNEEAIIASETAHVYRSRSLKSTS